MGTRGGVPTGGAVGSGVRVAARMGVGLGGLVADGAPLRAADVFVAVAPAAGFAFGDRAAEGDRGALCAAAPPTAGGGNSFRGSADCFSVSTALLDKDDGAPLSRAHKTAPMSPMKSTVPMTDTMRAIEKTGVSLRPPGDSAGLILKLRG